MVVKSLHSLQFDLASALELFCLFSLVYFFFPCKLFYLLVFSLLLSVRGSSGSLHLELLLQPAYENKLSAIMAQINNQRLKKKEKVQIVKICRLVFSLII